MAGELPPPGSVRRRRSADLTVKERGETGREALRPDAGASRSIEGAPDNAIKNLRTWRESLRKVFRQESAEKPERGPPAGLVEDLVILPFEQVDADPNQVLVAAVADGEVIGTLQLSLVPGLSRAGSLRGQIEGVRVRADRRGRGIGAALLRWAIDEARRRGCALVQLTTDKSRRDALHLYERLGFVASHEGLKMALGE